MIRRTLSLLLLLGCCISPSAAEKLELRENDHIAVIGNTLADRMQHSGWLESLIHSKFPGHNLVVRHLGFSGDELKMRHRSQDFGSPDEWLRHVEADVVFAMFGFNESFNGPGGVEQFKKDLQEFIKHTRSQDYSGTGTPRLVLFSPIAQEKHTDPNFPDPEEANQRIQYYVKAMAEVAKEQGVQFVDLFSASQAAYKASAEPLTINGIHLKDTGYKALAGATFKSLFGGEPPLVQSAAFDKLRAAVNEKNFQFFQRYRTIDGYNVYGGRSHLQFDGIKNRDTMQREMHMRDVMTANREKRVWAVAQGGDLEVRDDNLPEPVKVPTNKPGPNSDGSHVFLSGEEAIKRMKVPDRVEVQLFASEAEFPELANPVQMAFDTKGRLWVAVWPNYPERTPTSTEGDSLLIFEDTNHDGKADKVKEFIGDLNAPTGFQFYKDGVIVVQAPDVWFVRDTDGDDKADWKERILNGLDSADSHHTANALCLDPGGAIYLSDGVFHRTQVETAVGVVRNNDAAIYRFDPRASKFETYISYGFANPHGKVFDYWGNDFITDATGNNTYFGAAFSGHIDYPLKHSSMKQFWERPSRPCPGTGILSSQHFPEEFQGNFLNINVIGFQGIFRVKVKEEGSGIWGETIPDHLVVSDDPNFRPIAIDVAPDGSIYFLDWHNPIIGHMQHHLRDPNRDQKHGRIYRMTYEGRPLTPVAKVAGEPIEKLLELLKAPEDNVRTRAKIELGARETGKVIPAVQEWARQFDATRIEDQHHLMEALWVHQWHNVVNENLLGQMLQSPEHRARAAAVRVLCYWRDRVSQPLALIKSAANDSSPRVRLEAVRAASFFKGIEALEAAYEILKHDTDYYLDYTFNETLRQLQRHSKETYLPKDPVALKKAMARMSSKELLEAPEVPAVLIERLERSGVDLNARAAALDQLAENYKTDRATQAVAALQRLDRYEGSPAAINDIALLLGSSPATEINKHRNALLDVAKNAKQPLIRRAAFSAILSADGKPDKAWRATASDSNARAALIDSLVLVADPSARATFQPLLVEAISPGDAAEEIRLAALRALPLMGPENISANFDLLARQIRSGDHLTTAAQSLLQLPREQWKKEAAPALSEAILHWAKKVPAEKRTDQDYIETVQVGMETAAFLPPSESAKFRKELLSLGVRVFVIKTVREQMRYDVSRIVVEAGKPFEIILENTDFMPHNLVIVQPGAREEIGLAAQAMQPTPDRNGLIYVPKSKKIVAASKMLEAGQKQTLKLTAPETPGDYEYVCTYPEHWKVMFGQMVVVKDIDAFLATNDRYGAPEPVAKAAHGDHGHEH